MVMYRPLLLWLITYLYPKGSSSLPLFPAIAYGNTGTKIAHIASIISVQPSLPVFHTTFP